MSGEPRSEATTRHSPTVSWFELFYDLVVVAAVGLTNDVFLDDPTVEDALLAMVFMTALAWVWFLTTLYNNVNPSQDVGRRLLLVAQMGAISIAGLAVDLDHGMDARGGLIAYGLALLIVAVLNATAGRRGRGVRLPYVPVLMASATCIVGGLLFSEYARYVLALALLVSIVPLLTFQYGSWRYAPHLRLEHLRERLGLFILIVLGEGFVQLVSSLHNLNAIPRGEMMPIVFLLAFAVWWIYFDGTYREGTDLHTVRWRLALLGHLTLVFGIAGTLDILVLITAGEDRELGDELLTYFVICVALVLVSFATLGLTIHQRLGPQGWSALVSAALIVVVGVVLVPQNDTSTLMVVLLSAVIVIGHAVAAVVTASRTAESPISE